MKRILALLVCLCLLLAGCAGEEQADPNATKLNLRLTLENYCGLLTSTTERTRSADIAISCHKTFLKKFFEISEISSSEVILIVNRFYSLLIVIISMKFITSLLALSP